MREIIIDDRPFNIRGLKRGEIKALKKEGFNLIDLKIEQADDAMDKVFELVFASHEITLIDDMANKDAMKLWTAILKETYGAPDEEKN
jgi:hypothetical protein